jgi:hypothetical protein
MWTLSTIARCKDQPPSPHRTPTPEWYRTASLLACPWGCLTRTSRIIAFLSRLTMTTYRHTNTPRDTKWDYDAAMADRAWWIVASCLGLCALTNLFRIGRAQLRKHRSGISPSTNPPRGDRHSSVLLRTARAVEAVWKDVVFLRTLPLWLYTTISLAEVFWTVGYMTTCILLGMYPTICERTLYAVVSGRIKINTRLAHGQDWANPMGHIVSHQLLQGGSQKPTD